MKYAVVCLGLLLIAQLSVISTQRRRRLPEGPVLGEPLPPVQVRAMDRQNQQDLTKLLTENGTCSILVMVDTGCSWCRRMRSTWPSQLEALVGELGIPIKGVWLANEDIGVLARFCNGFDFRGVARAVVMPGMRKAFRRLGVFSTPTTYVVDSDGRLRYGLTGDRFPKSEVVETICR